jgi:hypothetical protein
MALRLYFHSGRCFLTASEPFPASGLLENSKGCFCEIAPFPVLLAAQPQNVAGGIQALTALLPIALFNVKIDDRLSLPRLRRFWECGGHSGRCSWLPYSQE